MAKIVVLSSLLMAIWLPIVAARGARERLALTRTIRRVALFNAAYLVAMLYILPRLTH